MPVPEAFTAMSNSPKPPFSERDNPKSKRRVHKLRERREQGIAPQNAGTET